MRYVSWVLLAALAVFPSTASAATWHVAKDGSGDFAVIQDAVDAAADGDTIMIGPGRYDDFVSTPDDLWRVVNIVDKSLTFIGAGTDATIIGPENYGDIDGLYVYCIIVDGIGVVTRMRDLSCENVKDFGIRNLDEGRMEIEGCAFRNSDGGVFGVLGDGGIIRDCDFVEMNHGNSSTGILLYEPCVDVMVEDSRFTNCSVGLSGNWSGCEDFTVLGCTFSGGDTGVGVTTGASGAILQSSFSGQERFAIAGSSIGTLLIEGNIIDETGSEGSCICVWAAPGEYILRDNILSSDTTIVLLGMPNVVWDCRDNHFLRTGPDAWYSQPMDLVYGGEPLELDFSENYWGTTDPEEVAAWIFDGNDDPAYHYVIDFLPMADVVAVESRTFSEVKSLFRGGGGR